MTYHYAIGLQTADGRETRSPVATAEVGRFATALAQNYPNPFNPTTTIGFTLFDDTIVKLSVYDAQGRLVVTLEDGVRDAGVHTVSWDGRDAAGQFVGTGVYFYRLNTGGKIQAKKMLLLK